MIIYSSGMKTLGLNILMQKSKLLILFTFTLVSVSLSCFSFAKTSSSIIFFRYIKLVKKHGLEISQPGLEPNKGLTWQMTKRREELEVHKYD